MTAVAGDTIRATGFPPVATPDSRILILGSMPGVRSLEEQQYYAQPRNAFWRIMGELFGASPEPPYSDRLAALQAAGVALWDVLRECERPGSLDSNIDMSSAEVNDFNGFFASHRGVHTIFFNGQTAAKVFRQRVMPELTSDWNEDQLISLPSTSPAHAAMSFDEKLAHWSACVLAVDGDR